MIFYILYTTSDLIVWMRSSAVVFRCTQRERRKPCRNGCMAKPNRDPISITSNGFVVESCFYDEVLGSLALTQEAATGHIGSYINDLNT